MEAKVPNALLSHYEKTGTESFAAELIALGYTLYASGGTARVIAAAGIPVVDVAELTGHGAILGHRVVTLSPQIHAGLLCRDSDEAEMQQLGYPRFDLVSVDLYPMEQAIDGAGISAEAVLELTDVGGRSILMSAVKGRRIVISDPADRTLVVEWLKEGAPIGKGIHQWLLTKAERIVARYTLASARYHSRNDIDGIIGESAITCAYGENRWQGNAALLSAGSSDPLSLDRFDMIEGSDPSYNNLCDLDRSLQTVTHIAAGFEVNFGSVPKIAVAMKHGNACGAGVYDTADDAISLMIRGDRRAIFGGAVMVNFPIGVAEAGMLLHWRETAPKRLLDLIAAPAFSKDAVGMLLRKGGKCRMLVNPALGNLGRHSLDTAMRFKTLRGTILRQSNYTYVFDRRSKDVELVLPYGMSPSAINWRVAILAWAVGSTSTSNTVSIATHNMLIGNGVGQQDRVGVAKLALERAREAGHVMFDVSVAYSDSFFPFPDGPTILCEAGVGAIMATKGSVNDEQVRECVMRYQRPLILVPDAIGRGFYGH